MAGTKAPAKAKDPLGPIDLVLAIILGLFAGGLVFGGVFTALGNHSGTIFDMGGDTVCVSTDLSTFALDENPYDRKEVRADEGVHRGVSIDADSARLCDHRPGLREQVLVGLTHIPSFVVFFGFVFLTRRIITYSRRNGLFSAELAGRITRLGWLLLGGLIVAEGLEGLARGLLLSGMVDSFDWASGLGGISVPALIGAAGVITIGRVMANAADLQADSDATI